MLQNWAKWYKVVTWAIASKAVDLLLPMSHYTLEPLT